MQEPLPAPPQQRLAYRWNTATTLMASHTTCTTTAGLLLERSFLLSTSKMASQFYYFDLSFL
jgi:hypothetical protein